MNTTRSNSVISLLSVLNLLIAGFIMVVFYMEGNSADNSIVGWVVLFWFIILIPISMNSVSLLILLYKHRIIAQTTALAYLIFPTLISTIFEGVIIVISILLSATLAILIPVIFNQTVQVKNVLVVLVFCWQGIYFLLMVLSW